VIGGLLNVTHHRIDNPDSAVWCLTPIIHKGGVEVINTKNTYLEDVVLLPLKNDWTINLAKQLKSHLEGLLESGISSRTLRTNIIALKAFIRFLDKANNELCSVEDLTHSLFAYSELLLTRVNLKEIKNMTAYDAIARCAALLNGAVEDFKFDVAHTRVKKEKKSRRALGREAEKVMLTEAAKLANFCFELTKNFKASSLTTGMLPIYVKANDKLINFTPARVETAKVSQDFSQTAAYMAFNFRVVAEVFIFLGMTLQNQAPTYNLKRVKFNYKPLGDNYEVREYKHRRGGEVLFKIPKPYRSHFEDYLLFIDNYAPKSKWLFPYLEKYKGFKKRTDQNTSRFKSLCSRYDVPWIKPSAFRSIGENILLRLSSDEQTAADYANHAIATFRDSYELPSLQRAMVEVTRFWNESDPLNKSGLTVSLFNSPCDGVPTLIEEDMGMLPKPDCISPTGCIGCSHYRDEESLEYVWGLLSFKYLKIIEASSYISEEQKPSNIVIDWVNNKVQWFKTSNNKLHREWVAESEKRIEEGDYHPSWSRKIEKYEG
jgi:hypothetical protein